MKSPKAIEKAAPSSGSAGVKAARSQHGDYMIGFGEATGAMDAMLQKIADFYED